MINYIIIAVNNKKAPGFPMTSLKTLLTTFYLIKTYRLVTDSQEEKGIELLTYLTNKEN
jgi:hypothetical protein